MAKGTVILKQENDISTDIIYPGRFMATVLPSETPQFAFADDKAFNKTLNDGLVPAGSFIVAGDNFGCGSSREQAASCIKGYEITVVARNFARIFLQNSINVGLQMIICPEIDAGEGDELEVRDNRVFNLTTGKSFPIEALPQARQGLRSRTLYQRLLMAVLFGFLLFGSAAAQESGSGFASISEKNPQNRHDQSVNSLQLKGVLTRVLSGIHVQEIPKK